MLEAGYFTKKRGLFSSQFQRFKATVPTLAWCMALMTASCQMLSWPVPCWDEITWSNDGPRENCEFHLSAHLPQPSDSCTSHLLNVTKWGTKPPVQEPWGLTQTLP
jgi:hypothetical protein